MQFNLNADGPGAKGEASGRFALVQQRQTLVDGDFKLALQPTLSLSSDLKLQIPAARALELAKPYLPEAASSLQIANGDLQGRANLDWQANREIGGDAKLEVQALSLSANTISLQNANLSADLPDLSQKALKLAVKVPTLALGKSLNARDFELVASYRSQDHLVDLQQARLTIFDGSLALLPGIYSTQESAASLTLLLQDIDLAQLLASLQYPDISGTGKLNGSLPIAISTTGIDLQDGELTGTQPGVLRYLGKAADPNNLAFQALRNLAYHGLKAKLSYRPNGDYQLGLRLEGHNPEVLSGHPLAFNLNISGQLPELLQKGLLSGNFERAVIEQATSQPSAPPKPKPARPGAETHQPLTPPPADRRNQ